jgi:cell division protease FtsH
VAERPPLVERAERLGGAPCDEELGRLLHALAAQRGRSRVAALDAGAVAAAWVASALRPGTAFLAAEARPAEAGVLAELFAEDADAGVLAPAALPGEAPFDLLVAGGAVDAAGLLVPGGTAVALAGLAPRGRSLPCAWARRRWRRACFSPASRMPMGDAMVAGIGDFIQDFALTWLPVMFFVLMCFIVFLLWRTLQVMPRIKPTAVEPNSSSSVTWADVAGTDDARAELEEVVDFLKNPKRFERLGARVPKGILLYGPPGTGKTLLAKAVANESGASFYAQSASAFVEMFAGLGASRIRKLFETARKNSPAIVFIDELDAVGAARTGHGFNREQDQTLNQLLVELDGFGGREQVIVMGASNRLQDLDPALLRPGRFDRQVLVGPPDVRAREEILGVHTRGKPLAADVDLGLVARQTAGLTGADLANIANEAAIFAGRRERQYIHQEDFSNAMERVVAGLQQRRVVTEKEKRILAYHEAGHALMSHLMGDLMPVQKATIVSRGQALGYTLNMPNEDRYLHTREELIDTMKIYLAGRAAEQVVFGRVTNGAANDLERVTALARAMVFEYGMSEEAASRTMRADNYALSEETKRLRDSEQARLTDGAFEAALDLLRGHRAALDRVANALLERETLDREELDQLLADVAPTSRASETVGTVRVLPVSPD